VPFKHIDVHTFFTDRNEVVERAISDCTEKLIKQNNDELVGSWLLTEYVLANIQLLVLKIYSVCNVCTFVYTQRVYTIGMVYI